MESTPVWKRSCFWFVVALLAGFVLRCLWWERVFVDGWGMFYGPDPYYYLRRVELALAHGLVPPLFDSYYNHPHGVTVYTPHLFASAIAAVVRWVCGPEPSHEAVTRVMVWVSPVAWLVAGTGVYALARICLGGARWAAWATGLAALLPAPVSATRLGYPDTQCVEAVICTALPAALLYALAKPGLLRVLLIAAVGLGGMLCWPGVLMYILVSTGLLLGLRALFARSDMGAWLDGGRLAPAAGLAFVAIGIALYAAIWPAGWSLDRTGYGSACAVAVCALAWCIPGRRYVTAWLAPVVLCAAVGGLYLLTGRAGEAGQLSATAKISELEPMLGYGFAGVYRPLVLFSPLIVAVLLFGWWLLRGEGEGGARDARSGVDVAYRAGAWMLVLLLTFGLATSLLVLKQAHVAGLYWSIVLAYGAMEAWRRNRDRRVLLGAVGVVSLAVALYPSLQAPSRYSHPLSARWQGLFYLRDHTPPPADAMDPRPDVAPDYGVLTSFWDDSHFLTAIARRPSVASGMHVGFEANRAVAAMAMARDEASAAAVMDRVGARYYLWSYNLEALPQYAMWAGERGWRGVQTINGRLAVDDSLLGLYSIRLALGDGGALAGWPASRHFRLLYEKGEPMHVLGGVVARYKLFEQVPGCTLEITTQPYERIDIRLPIQTNLERGFVYTTRIEADETGRASVVVPYATVDGPPGCAPADGYRLTCTSGTTQVSVREVDVWGGSVAVEL